MRTIIKQLRTSLREGKAEEVAANIRRVESVVDSAASKGVIHKKAASRTKARLYSQLSKLSAK